MELCKSGRNFIVKLWQHMCSDLIISIAGEVEEKEELKKLVKVR